MSSTRSASRLLDFAAPLATGWLFRHRSLATLLGTGNSVAGDAVAGHAAAVIAVAARLPAGVGVLDRRLPALAARPPALGAARRPPVRAALRAARADRGVRGGSPPCRAWTRRATGPSRCRRRRPDDRERAAALRRVCDRGQQRRAGRAHRALAAGVRRQPARLAARALLPAPGLVSCSGSSCPATGGAALSLAPTVLIHVLVWGCVSFLADVVLLSVYIDTIERGTLPAN